MSDDIKDAISQFCCILIWFPDICLCHSFSFKKLRLWTFLRTGCHLLTIKLLFILSPRPTKAQHIVLPLTGTIQAVSVEPAHVRMHKQFPLCWWLREKKHSSIRTWRCPEGFCVCAWETGRQKSHFTEVVPDKTVDTIRCNPSNCSAGDTVIHTVSHGARNEKNSSSSYTHAHKTGSRGTLGRGQVDYIKSWVWLQVRPCHLQGVGAIHTFMQRTPGRSNLSGQRIKQQINKHVTKAISNMSFHVCNSVFNRSNSWSFAAISAPQHHVVHAVSSAWENHGCSSLGKVGYEGVDVCGAGALVIQHAV